jgi:hypothetical protein
MLDNETRLRQAEAFALLTNRILLDYISLQIDSGKMTRKEAKQLTAFSAEQVVKGSPSLKPEVDFFRDVTLRRFDETKYQND